MSGTSVAAAERLDRPEAEQHQQQRVVVGVDGSAGGTAALAWALQQARLLGATLEAVGCWTLPVDPSALDLGSTVGDLLEGAVASALRSAPGSDTVTVQRRVVEGHPARALLEAAQGADLLVVGSRGHGELSGLLLSSVGLYCVSHAHCPVVVVRQPAAAS